MSPVVIGLVVVVVLVVVLVVGLRVATAKSRARRRGFEKQAAYMGFSRYSEGVRDTGLADIENRRAVTDLERDGDRLEGTFRGYHVSCVPSDDLAVVVMLQQSFAGAFSKTLELEGGERMRSVRRAHPNLKELATARLEPETATRVRELGVIEFLERYSERLARFRVERDRVGCHFVRGGSPTKSMHRFLDPEDLNGVVPDLVGLARRIDAVSGDVDTREREQERSR